MDQFVVANLRTPSGVAGAKTGEVRRQQRVEAQLAAPRFIEHFEFCTHEQYRPVRIRQHVFDEAVAPEGFRIREPVKEAIALRVIDQMIEVAFFLVAKRFSVADEKLKVARVRLVYVRIVNLIDDSVTEGEPHTATCMVSRADAFFRT